MVQLRTGSVCITGNYRENNEDRCLVDPDGRYYIVADGMGGHQAGEVASQLAVEMIQSTLQNRGNRWTIADLKESIEQANSRVLQESLQDPNKHGMGTTAVVLVISHDGHVVLAHVGDSRAYALTAQGLKQLTEDHSVVFQLVKEGKITEEELMSWTKENLTNWKCPAIIEFIEEVPKNILGKVQRRILQINDPLWKEKFG